MTDKEITDLQEWCFGTPADKCETCQQKPICKKYMDIIGWSPAWSTQHELTAEQIEQLKGG